MNVRLTFLGTGTSQGVPVVSCPCRICSSADPRDKRLRSSVMFTVGGRNIVIDTGPDFRQQMLRERVKQIAAVVFTHAHKDHIAGMDDVRAFNFTSGAAVDVFAEPLVQDALRREFAYVFDGSDYPGIPKINLHTIHSGLRFFIDDIPLTPIPVLHYRLPVLGFRVADIVYITDANHIPEASRKLIRGAKVLVLNALRREKHISHFTLDEAVALAEDLRAERTYFTHISHQMGLHEEVNRELPAHIQLAWDGLTVDS
ncbi:MAG: MBL fold metallo-hydrolase [Bacteroidia bacterium]|nr:MBL fold metallo-hydrolase [Bacteroidia bacterium]